MSWWEKLEKFTPLPIDNICKDFAYLHFGPLWYHNGTMPTTKASVETAPTKRYRNRIKQPKQKPIFVKLRVTPEEKSVIAAAAKAKRTSESSFCLDIVMDAIENQAPKLRK